MSRSVSLGLQAVVILLAGLSVRLVGLGQDAGGDELYHVLAARSYLEQGTLSINGGEPYDRSAGFTLLVAGLFRVFGESLPVARLPAVVAGSLLPVLIFLWLAACDRAAAGWIAALLLVFDPMGLVLADQARFYTTHQLLFVAASCGVYLLAEGRMGRARSLALGVGVVLALVVADHLQDSTKVGVLALAAYVALAGGPALVRWISRRPERWWLVAGVVVAVALLAPFLSQAVDLEGSLELARHADPWAAGSVQAWRFYHELLVDSYPALWALFPVLLLFAGTSHPRATLLSASVFAVPLLVHSLLAWKAERYIQYAMPFFFAACGLGLAALVPLVRSAADRLAGRLGWLGREGRAERVTRALVLVAAIGFFVAGTPAFKHCAKLLLRDPRLTHPGMEGATMSWSLASPRLAPLVAGSEVVLSTDDTKALYYLGRLDYVLDWDHLVQWGPRAEFTVDQTVNAPLVTTPESLERIRACHASGLVVAQTWSLETDWKVPRATAAFIERTFTPVPLPEAWGLRAYRWETPAPVREGCPPRPR